METTVQSFVQKEVAALMVDDKVLDEWRILGDELGLVAQKSLAQDSKSPIPYLWLNTTMYNIINQLCPVHVSVEDYSKTPIPLEVLKALKICKSEKYFDKIEIWYTDIEPDPVCVGLKYVSAYVWETDQNNKTEIMKANKYEYQKTYKRKDIPENDFLKLLKLYGCHDSEKYLVARWGDIARSFTELKDMAIKSFVNSTVSKLKEEIKQAQRKLEDIEINAVKQFG